MKIYTVRSIKISGSDSFHKVEANSYEEAIKTIERMTKTCIAPGLKLTHELIKVEDCNR